MSFKARGDWDGSMGAPCYDRQVQVSLSPMLVEIPDIQKCLCTLGVPLGHGLFQHGVKAHFFQPGMDDVAGVVVALLDAPSILAD